MVEEIGAGDGGGEVGGVRQRRYLVAEERTRDDGTSGPVHRHLEARADAHKGEPDRSDRAPGRAERDRDDRTHDHGGGQEDLRREGLEPVVDQSGHGAGGDPDADDHPDDDQHRHRGKRDVDHAEHAVFHVAPVVAEVGAHQRGDREADRQRNMRREVAEIEQLYRQHAERQHDGNERQPE